jgi:hypothetical protein
MKNIINNSNSNILIIFIFSILLSISLCDIIDFNNTICRNKISENEYQGLLAIFNATAGENWEWIDSQGMYLYIYLIPSLSISHTNIVLSTSL